jgi:hydrogenase maturation protease
MYEQSQRKVVLGLVNPLLGDEGFGIHLVRYLKEITAIRYPVEWVDGSLLGLDLLQLVGECSHLVVLDIVDSGKPSGTVLELGRSEILRYRGTNIAEYQMRFQEVLAKAKLRDHYPTFLHLIGVRPADFTPGMELNPTVKAALPEPGWRVKSVLQTWFQIENWQAEPDTHPYHM